MSYTLPSSARARSALECVREIQRALADRLEAVAGEAGAPKPFAPVHWQRDGGRHGGGTRLVCGDTPVFDRASINISAVHYDDRPDRRLAGATALSTIVHPAHPRAPSMHMHLSHTEMRGEGDAPGRGYWRIMADLNPSMPDDDQTARFRAALEEALGPHFAEAAAQGDRYFHIPALGRHRGVVHVYLEGFDSGDFAADRALAERTGRAVIATYGELLDEAFAAHGPPTADEKAAQLAYHTLYLFQVLTLDRGTTSGLLVHDQNDVGILGSLPSRVDRGLLAEWRAKVPPPQGALVEGLVGALKDLHPSLVDVETKKALAGVVRDHYQRHPEALALQARGSIVPPTVANHR